MTYEDEKFYSTICIIIIIIISIATTIFVSVTIRNNKIESENELAVSLELCGSKANTILIQKLPDKMPNVTYYAICRAGDKVETKTK